jgi:hypothetical protein
MLYKHRWWQDVWPEGFAQQTSAGHHYLSAHDVPVSYTLFETLYSILPHLYSQLYSLPTLLRKETIRRENLQAHHVIS